MGKKTTSITGIAIAVIVIGIIFAFLSLQEFDVSSDEGKPHDMVWSGPLGVTKYKHKLGDDVFFIIRGLQDHERGVIHVYTPEGIEYKTIYYDGSLKSDFNQYFYPDTSFILEICKPEQLVGIWNAVFENNVYPTLQFEMTDEWIGGAEASITVVC
jgi:hypothetical protein